MSRRLFISLLLLAGAFSVAVAQLPRHSVSGRVISRTDGRPVEYATVYLGDNDLWAITDRQGNFTVRNVPQGQVQLKVQCLGYDTRRMGLRVDHNVTGLRIQLRESNLSLDEVVVTAKRKTEDATTSYIIDRAALDNQQIINLSDIMTLMPGGKTVNSSLMNDQRMALRSGDAEKGNASFGTAVEMDGQRVQNNAEMGETAGVSTRNISSTNIESVEVVPGIPSVEYGDLSNGIVKVNTRRGKTPYEVNFSTNPYTKQIAVSKGFNIGAGILNTSLEHTRSYSDQASPYTAYQRNTLALNYQQTFNQKHTPLRLNLNLNGNIGGYNSKADPDEFVDTYTKVRDHVVRGNFTLDWLLNQKWITNLHLSGNFSIADKLRTTYMNDNNSATQPQIHAREAGYFIATEYDEDPSAPIILGPTGYWYVKSFRDNKPVSYALKMKADWSRTWGRVKNKLLLGAEWTSTGNEGRGAYYEDMRYAPTWREYRYDELPYMNNYSFYGEEKFTLPTSRISSLQIMAGLRSDVTSIRNSVYGTASSLSPRVNLKHVFWERRHDWFLSGLNVYGGWGKSVKLPSFEVLYPSPAYADRIAFTPGSTADNKAFYAYSVTPFTSQRNPDLRWQYNHQWELGAEVETSVATLSLAAFFTKMHNPYIRTSIFEPFTYLYTGQAALENDFPIAVANRQYSIDRQTGVVTVTDRTGAVAATTLSYKVRNTFQETPTYTNGSPIYRSGLDWILDFRRIPLLRTSVRLDGNFYHYHGVEHSLIASQPSGAMYMSDGETPYQYVGHYHGTAVYGSESVAYATVPNGSLKNTWNTNLTLTTHVPRIRLIVTLRIETTLYDYRHSLSEGIDGTSRGYVLDDPADNFGTPHNAAVRDRYVAIYPEYYSTWDRPGELIPFAEKFIWARYNDQDLYNDLAKLVVKTNYNYNLNPDQISAYVSANINITKEIGRHVSVSFLANNFLNSMAKVKSRQTGLRTTIYNGGYIPPFYYGLSVRLKL